MRNIKDKRQSEITRSMLVRLLVTIAGFAIGLTAFSRIKEVSLWASESAEAFKIVRAERQIMRIFLVDLANSSFLLTVVFMLGLSAWAKICVPIINVIFGIGGGVSFAAMFSDNKKTGALICAVIIMPRLLLVTYAFLCGCMEATQMSGLFMQVCFCESASNGINRRIRSYCAKFLILWCIMGIGATVDVVCSMCIGGIII